MDAYDNHYGVDGDHYTPFAPYISDLDDSQPLQAMSGFEYEDISYLPRSSVKAPLDAKEFTPEFLWGMTLGTMIFMVVVCLALWCCLPMGLGSAAYCYVRRRNKKRRELRNSTVIVA